MDLGSGTGFAMWCAKKKRKKSEFALFSFALCAFAFIALSRSYLCFALANVKARKKRGSPPLLAYFDFLEGDIHDVSHLEKIHTVSFLGDAA
jgi:hypothetical protein